MRQDRLEAFLAGVIGAAAIAALVISMICASGCDLDRPAQTDTWIPVSAGDYAVYMEQPGVLLIEVRLGEDDRLRWRVSKMVSPLPTPTPAPRLMASVR